MWLSRSGKSGLLSSVRFTLFPLQQERSDRICSVTGILKWLCNDVGEMDEFLNEQVPVQGQEPLLGSFLRPCGSWKAQKLWAILMRRVLVDTRLR